VPFVFSSGLHGSLEPIQQKIAASFQKQRFFFFGITRNFHLASSRLCTVFSKSRIDFLSALIFFSFEIKKSVLA